MEREELRGIDSEVEEDGREHLSELLESSEEFRQIWEARRARRELGMLILKRRLEFGLTQKELARLAGTSQNRIYLIESGDANPTLDTLQRLAGALDFSLEIRPTELAAH
jgi:predicted transcriptional regulator